MPDGDDAPDEFVYDAADQLCHDLKTPLTAIYARAYLLARAIRRAPSLADEERVTMEILTGIKRAGADLILTYHALEAANWLK